MHRPLYGWLAWEVISLFQPNLLPWEEQPEELRDGFSENILRAGLYLLFSIACLSIAISTITGMNR